MIFDKKTGQKIAEGKGLVLPSDKPGTINSKPWRDANADPIQQMQNALDYFKLREKMTIPELPFPKEAPVLSFKVKISKRRLNLPGDRSLAYFAHCVINKLNKLCLI